MQNWLQKPEGLPSSENTRVLPRTQNKHPRQKFCPNKKNESNGYNSTLHFNNRLENRTVGSETTTLQILFAER